MKRSLRAATAAALLCVSALPATAEPLEVTVPVDMYGTLTAPSVWQAQQAIGQIPGGAAVVPAKGFQEGYALSMKDMLSATPGVFVQPRWGEESRLSIRGSGLSRSFHLRGLNLLQDGIPFNFADGSGDFQEIDPLVLQHVEVYRGGQALRYGAATLGGAVNMVTPTAKTAGHTALLRAEGGSFKTGRLHAQTSQQFEHGDVFAAATRTVSNGFRLQSEQDNERFSGNIGVPLGPDAETRFYLNWNNLKQEVPGTISKPAALNNPKTVSAINILDDYARDIRSLRLANRTALELDNGAVWEVGGYMNDKSLYHPIFQVIDQQSLDLGLFSRLSGPWNYGDYVLGLNLGRGVNNADRFDNLGGERGTQRADARQIADNIEIYGENRFSPATDWALITGAQTSLALRDYTNHLDEGKNADTDFKSFNPKLGVLWNVTPETDIYASITRSSEVPTFSELVQGATPGFIPVKLQKAWTAEIGTRGAYEAFSWDATIYHARVKDEMLQFTTSPSIPASTFNADDTIHQGVELGLGWQALEDIGFQAIYNFNDFTFDGDTQFGDNDLAGAPPHQIRVSMRYENSGFHIEPNVEWVPEAGWVDYANTLKADSYTVLGVKAGYEPMENVSLFLDGRNLTDERFISSYSTLTNATTATNLNVFYPGDGRSLFAGVSVRF